MGLNLSRVLLLLPLLQQCHPLNMLNAFGIFPLTFDIPIKIPGISISIPNQVIDIQVMLLPYISFDFPS